MTIEVKCPNPDCAKVFKVKDELAGKKGKCSQCGTAIHVPAAAPSGTPAGTQEQAKAFQYNPARQICTNCGAVLGVRAMTCPQCGGDVRTGVTKMRVTAEEKKKAGLGKALAAWRRSGRRGMPFSRVIVVVVMLVVLAGLVVAAVLKFKGKGSPEGEEPHPTQPATEMAE